MTTVRTRRGNSKRKRNIEMYLQKMAVKDDIWAIHVPVPRMRPDGECSSRISATLEHTDWESLRGRETSVSQREFTCIPKNVYRDEETERKLVDHAKSLFERRVCNLGSQPFCQPSGPGNDDFKMVVQPGLLAYIIKGAPRLQRVESMREMLEQWGVALTQESRSQKVYLKQSTLTQQSADPCLQHKDPNRIEIGGFASTKFKTGDFIAEYVGVVVVDEPRPEAGDDFSQATQDLSSQEVEQVEKKSVATEYQFDVIIDDLHAVVDATEKGNEACFINTHTTDNVNAIFVEVVLNGHIHVLVVAVKPIEKDEEIFVEYGEGYRNFRAKLQRAIKCVEERRRKRASLPSSDNEMYVDEEDTAAHSEEEEDDEESDDDDDDDDEWRLPSTVRRESKAASSPAEQGGSAGCATGGTLAGEMPRKWRGRVQLAGKLECGQTVEADRTRRGGGTEKRKAIIIGFSSQRQAYELQWADGDCDEEEHWKAREKLVPFEAGAREPFVRAVLDDLCACLERRSLPLERSKATAGGGVQPRFAEEGAAKSLEDAVETLRRVRPASLSVFDKVSRAFGKLRQDPLCAALADVFNDVFHARVKRLVRTDIAAGATPERKRAADTDDGGQLEQGKRRKQKAASAGRSAAAVRRLSYCSSSCGGSTNSGSSSGPESAPSSSGPGVDFEAAAREEAEETQAVQCSAGAHHSSAPEPWRESETLPVGDCAQASELELDRPTSRRCEGLHGEDTSLTDAGPALRSQVAPRTDSLAHRQEEAETLLLGAEKQGIEEQNTGLRQRLSQAEREQQRLEQEVEQLKGDCNALRLQREREKRAAAEELAASEQLGTAAQREGKTAQDTVSVLEKQLLLLRQQLTQSEENRLRIAGANEQVGAVLTRSEEQRAALEKEVEAGQAEQRKAERESQALRNKVAELEQARAGLEQAREQMREKQAELGHACDAAKERSAELERQNAAHTQEIAQLSAALASARAELEARDTAQEPPARASSASEHQALRPHAALAPSMEHAPPPPHAACTCQCVLGKLVEQARCKCAPLWEEGGRVVAEMRAAVAAQLEDSEKETRVWEETRGKLNALSTSASSSGTRSECSAVLAKLAAQSERLQVLQCALSAHVQLSEKLVAGAAAWSCPCAPTRADAHTAAAKPAPLARIDEGPGRKRDADDVVDLTGSDDGGDESGTANKKARGGGASADLKPQICPQAAEDNSERAVCVTADVERQPEPAAASAARALSSDPAAPRSGVGSSIMGFCPSASRPQSQWNGPLHRRHPKPKMDPWDSD